MFGIFTFLYTCRYCTVPCTTETRWCTSNVTSTRASGQNEVVKSMSVSHCTCLDLACEYLKIGDACHGSPIARRFCISYQCYPDPLFTHSTTLTTHNTAHARCVYTVAVLRRCKLAKRLAQAPASDGLGINDDDKQRASFSKQSIG
jgi:hypothetical protein